MAFNRGKDTELYITDSAGTARNITTYASGYDQTLESDELDTTVFGSAYKSAIRGFLGFSGSVNGMWDSAATANPDQWFTDLITAASTVTSTMTVFPNGSASARKYYRAAVYFGNYKVSSAVDAMITWSADFTLASGSVTIGTA
jgi:hypothetical protein